MTFTRKILTGLFLGIATGLFFGEIVATLEATPPVIDLVGLYISSNPFASMAGNMVPAVVLFSIFVGIGLSSVPGNGALFAHWIEGGGAEIKEPRWSIIRDVLGWVE